MMGRDGEQSAAHATVQKATGLQTDCAWWMREVDEGGKEAAAVAEDAVGGGGECGGAAD